MDQRSGRDRRVGGRHCAGGGQFRRGGERSAGRWADQGGAQGKRGGRETVEGDPRTVAADRDVWRSPGGLEALRVSAERALDAARAPPATSRSASRAVPERFVFPAIAPLPPASSPVATVAPRALSELPVPDSCVAPPNPPELPRVIARPCPGCRLRPVPARRRPRRRSGPPTVTGAAPWARSGRRGRRSSRRPPRGLRDGPCAAVRRIRRCRPAFPRSLWSRRRVDPDGGADPGLGGGREENRLLPGAARGALRRGQCCHRRTSPHPAAQASRQGRIRQMVTRGCRRQSQYSVAQPLAPAIFGGCPISSSIPPTRRPPTSRRRSRVWPRAWGRASASRPCSARPAPARPSRWRRWSSGCSARPW